MARMIVSVLLAGCLTLAACDPAAEEDDGLRFWDTVYHSSSALRIEAAYVDSPRFYPHTGDLYGKNPFEYCEDTVREFFPGRTVRIPRQLGDMHNLGSSRGPYTLAKLQMLSRELDGFVKSTEPFLHLVFVDGPYVHESGITAPDMAGLSLTPTGSSKPGEHIYLFMTAINISGTPPNPVLDTYAQYETMMHEIGHALGLVNNGLPMQKKHSYDLDPQQPSRHCDNKECVMFWVASRDVYAWRERVSRGQLTLFDEACRNDIAAYMRQQ